MKEHWNRLGIFTELDTEYIHVEKGYSLFSITDQKRFETLEVKMKLKNGLLVKLCIFIDEPVTADVWFAIGRDNELIATDSLPIEEIVKKLKNIEVKIKKYQDENESVGSND